MLQFVFQCLSYKYHSHLTNLYDFTFDSSNPESCPTSKTSANPRKFFEEYIFRQQSPLTLIFVTLPPDFLFVKVFLEYCKNWYFD